jgi:hypothetical protein
MVIEHHGEAAISGKKVFGPFEREVEILKSKLLVPDPLCSLMQAMLHPSAQKRPSCTQILRDLAMNTLNEPSSVRESRSTGEGLKIEEAYQMN